MKAFLSGSHVYGFPTKKSDVDLVVWLSPDDMNKLVELSPKANFLKRLWKLFFKEIDQSEYKNKTDAALRFGKLNLLCVTTEKQYNDWTEGTAKLKAKAPVTRDVAVDMFEEIFNREHSLDDGVEDIYVF